MNGSPARNLADRLAGILVSRTGLFASAFLLLCYQMTAGGFGADPDLFARVAMGRLIDVQGGVPAADPFAFTPKKSVWIDHEWLAGWVFYHVSQFGGDRAFFLFKTACIAVSLAFLVAAIFAYNGRIGLAGFAWVLFLAGDCSYIWASTVRSQVFTFMFISLALWCFARAEKRGGRSILFLVSAVMPVWCNAHGGFVVGIGFQLIFALSALLLKRPYAPHAAAAFLLSLILTSVNPYGFREYWAYILDAVTMARPSIGEWNSVNIFSAAGIVTIFAASVAVAGLVAEKRVRDLPAALLIAASVFYALRHERLAAILNFTAAVYAVRAPEVVFGRIADLLSLNKIVLGRTFAAVFGAAALIMLAQVLRFAGGFGSFRLDYSAYPQRALQWLTDTQPGGKVLIDFNNGSYALWRLYPKFLISLDGRYEEVYPDPTVEKVSRALNCSDSGMNEALSELSPDFIVLRRSAECEDQRSGWNAIYRDNIYSVMAKGSPFQQPAREAGPDTAADVWNPRF